MKGEKLASVEFFSSFLSRKEAKELARGIKAYKKRPTANRTRWGISLSEFSYLAKWSMP